MKRFRAFTLIELLVVISIITVLLSILLPALARSRQLGKSTVCLTNLHSMSQAAQMYADNNEGRLPAVGLAHGGSVDEGNAWVNTMVRETGGTNIVKCPADQSKFWVTPFGSTGQYRRMSYATNYYTVGAIEGKEEYNELTRVLHPSKTIMWAELIEDGDFAVSDHVHPETWFANPLPLASQELQLQRHMGKENYGMLDGHSESMRFDQTYSMDVTHSHFPNIAWIHNKYDPGVGW